MSQETSLVVIDEEGGVIGVEWEERLFMPPNIMQCTGQSWTTENYLA